MSYHIYPSNPNILSPPASSTVADTSLLIYIQQRPTYYICISYPFSYPAHYTILPTQVFSIH